MGSDAVVLKFYPIAIVAVEPGPPLYATCQTWVGRRWAAWHQLLDSSSESHPDKGSSGIFEFTLVTVPIPRTSVFMGWREHKLIERFGFEAALGGGL
jgi:hypothetical protein